MSEITEKVAYLRGLADGLGIEPETSEKKLLLHMLEALELMAQQMDLLDTAQQETLDYVESVDESVAEMEEFLFDDDDSDDFEDDPCECCDGCCDGCALKNEDEEAQDE